MLLKNGNRIILVISIAALVAGTVLTGLSMLGNSGGETYYMKTADDIWLRGVYFEGGSECVIICHGFSSDWTNTTRIKDAYKDAGYSVLLFDFTGHGESGGKVAFDNAQTDRLSHDIEAAVESMKIRGFKTVEIILVGHSMGARSILQYAVDNPGLGGLVLIGAEVNLNTSRQASFFTGAVDVDMPFVRKLSGEIPKAPALILTTSIDDILPPDSAVLLYEAMGGESSSYTRDLLVLEDGGLHNYELFDRDVIEAAVTWVNDLSGNTEAGKIDFTKNNLWLAGLALILISPILLYYSIRKKKEKNLTVQIEKTTSFILSRLIIWLLAIPTGALVGGIFFFIPLPKPFFSMQFVIILGGYGVLATLLYRFGKMPFYRQKAHILSIMFRKPVTNKVFSFILIIVFTAISLVVRISGFNKIFTGMDYILWYAVFTILMTLGFYILNMESMMLEGCKRLKLFLWTLVKYMPFYLFAIFYGSLGSTSGLAGAVQGILFLVYGVYSAKVVRHFSDNDLLAALTIALVTAVPFGAVF